MSEASSSTPSVADVLRQAADLIETDGHWTAGQSDEGQDAYGAIWSEVADLDWPESYELGDAALDALMRHIGWPKTLEDLFRWNDEASGTRVVATMRECADAVQDVTTQQEGAVG